VIAVVGGSGKLGRLILKALVKKYGNQYKIRALARDPHKLKEFEGAVDVFPGDLGSSSQLSVFLQGTSFLIMASGTTSMGNFLDRLGLRAPTTDSAFFVEFQGMKNILKACSSDDVHIKKFVLISSSLVSKPFSPIAILLNTLVPDVMLWKYEAECLLRKSGINYAIIRPSGLLDDPKITNIDVSSEDGATSMSITRATVAEVTVHALFDSSIIDKTFTLGGLESGGVPISTEAFKSLRSDSSPGDPNLKFWHKLVTRGVVYVPIALVLTGGFFAAKFILGK